MTPITITRAPAARRGTTSVPAVGLARLALYRVMLIVEEDAGLDVLVEDGPRATVALTAPAGTSRRDSDRRDRAMERAFLKALLEMDPTLSVETGGEGGGFSRAVGWA